MLHRSAFFLLTFCVHVLSYKRQSCPWVGFTHGFSWVGLGMGRKFLFILGWVGLGYGSEMAYLRKQMSCTSSAYVTLCRQAIILLRENLHLYLPYCVRAHNRELGARLFCCLLTDIGQFVVCADDDVRQPVFLRPAGHLLFVIWGLDPDGLGWVMGPQVLLAVGCGSDQLYGGLGWVWVDEMDPWTTRIKVTCCFQMCMCAVHSA